MYREWLKFESVIEFAMSSSTHKQYQSEHKWNSTHPLHIRH